jgi:hypothetical protein
MLSSFRDRFGTAGLVVAIIALVAALAGGAVAAGNSGGKATASKAKGKVGPRGPRGPAGPAGPAGPQGPQGPQGPAGANGKDGSNGSNGAAGPTGPTGAKGSAGAAGAVGETGPTGATGPTGTFGGGTLPSGVTETGTWAVSGSVKTIKDGNGNMVTVGNPEAVAAISFPMPLFVAPEVGNPEVFIHFWTEPNFTDFDEGGSGTVGCTGSFPKPTAPNKTMCIYGNPFNLQEMTLLGTGRPPFYSSEAEELGTFVAFTVTGPEGRAAGSWAVTG